MDHIVPIWLQQWSSPWGSVLVDCRLGMLSGAAGVLSSLYLSLSSGVLICRWVT